MRRDPIHRERKESLQRREKRGFIFYKKRLGDGNAVGKLKGRGQPRWREGLIR